MALADVAKINIIGDKHYQQQCMEVLQNLGVVQIDEHPDASLEKVSLGDQLAELDYQLAGLKFSIDFLSPFDTKKVSLIEKIDSKIELSPTQIETKVKNFAAKAIIEATQEIETAINEATNVITKSQAELTALTPWKDLNFVPNHDQRKSDYDFKLISTTQELYQKLIAKLQKDLPLSSVEKASGREDKTIHASVVFKKAQDNQVMGILNQLEIKTIELPELEVTVSQALQQTHTRIEQAQTTIKQQHAHAQKLSSHLPDLKITFDYLTWQRDQMNNQQKLGTTWQTFSLVGWLDEKLINSVQAALQKVTDAVMVVKMPLLPDDQVPSQFANSWSEPFEMVTGLYGAPQRSEPDPTSFLAPFFVLFFGMAMTDAGYGLLLSIITVAAIKIFKIPRKKQKLLRVLFWGGVATFILGALTGGWFSIQLDALPAVIGQPLLAIQLINPIESPLVIFYLSLALGVVQVLTGLGIDLIWKIKSKQALDGVLGSGAWIVVIISLLLFAGGSMGLMPAVYGVVGKWLALSGAAIVVFNGMRSTKNVFLKPGLGILRLYGIVGYFSDILSYSRLLALGLTTGIIGMVVNLIAGLVYGIPFVGWLAALVVLVGGHIFNLVINALGAFIHSARLQFIEFFPKFMKGGGRAFEPFEKALHYVRVTDK